MPHKWKASIETWTKQQLKGNASDTNELELEQPSWEDDSTNSDVDGPRKNALKTGEARRSGKVTSYAR